MVYMSFYTAQHERLMPLGSRRQLLWQSWQEWKDTSMMGTMQAELQHMLSHFDCFPAGTSGGSGACRHPLHVLTTSSVDTGAWLYARAWASSLLRMLMASCTCEPCPIWRQGAAPQPRLGSSLSRPLAMALLPSYRHVVCDPLVCMPVTASYVLGSKGVAPLLNAS